MVINPIVNGAWLPKTLIDGGSSLNIIFTETLRKTEFDFSKMTACDEPFYGVVPGKAAYPIGRVCMPVTFGTEENIRTKYLTFKVVDFRSSYHAIFGRPMLAKFMPIPHHTYLIMKMPAPNESFPSSGTSWSPTIVKAPLSSSPKIQQSKPQQWSWSLRQPRSTKLPSKYRSKSVQTRLWTQVQLSKRFASACPTHPRKSSSGPTSTPNRNSRSPASLGTTLTSLHGVHPICLESPKSWLSTDFKSTRPLDLSSKCSGDLRKIENKL
jgi:hypothetical protein